MLREIREICVRKNHVFVFAIFASVELKQSDSSVKSESNLAPKSACKLAYNAQRVQPRFNEVNQWFNSSFT